MQAIGVIDGIIEPTRPPTLNRNVTISTSGHNCKIPVWVQIPVSIVPWKGGRAPVGYIVQCEICKAYWQARSVRARLGEPDLIWVQITKVRTNWWSRGQEPTPDLVFNHDVAWVKPDISNWDWNKGKPPRPDGMAWWQIDFPELLGTEMDRCNSMCTTRHKPPGALEYVQLGGRCELLGEHKGTHEAHAIFGGPTGWQ